MPPAKPKVEVNYELMSQEPWIRRLLDRLDSTKFKLDKSIVSELKHISKRTREQFTEKGLPRLPVIRDRKDMIALMEENAICLADRDRVTEILISYANIRYALDSLWEEAEGKLLESPMYRDLSNAEARNAFIAEVLRPIHDKRMHVKKVISLCETLQEHLSHTHFTIKQHAEMGVVILGQRSA